MSERWASVSASPSEDGEAAAIFPWLQLGQTANSATAAAPLAAHSHSNKLPLESGLRRSDGSDQQHGSGLGFISAAGPGTSVWER